jgi:hypothetical protein
MDTGKDKLHEDNPLHDAELVLYTSDAEWAEENPTHDILKELGLTSFSLWARWDDDGVEIPILGEPDVPKDEWPAICQDALEYRENNRNYIQQCKEWLAI